MRPIALVSTALLALAGAAAALAFQPDSMKPQHPAKAAPTKDIIDTAVGAGSFKTLAAALAAAGWVEPLKGAGPFTVFAPTDEAFAKLPAGTVETLLKPENKDKLAAILKYHVAKGAWMASQVATLSGATTLNGQRVDISAKGGAVMLDKATVTQADLVCTNGVIHVIDSVLMPETRTIAEVAQSASTFNTLLAAAKAAGLADALMAPGEWTVFAPTDEAFSKLPAGTVEMLLKPENKDKLAAILKYHILKGRVYSDAAATAGMATTLEGSKVTLKPSNGKLWVDKAAVTKADLDASNGVIHVIDAVIMPPAK